MTGSISQSSTVCSIDQKAAQSIGCAHSWVLSHGGSSSTSKSGCASGTRHRLGSVVAALHGQARFGAAHDAPAILVLGKAIEHVRGVSWVEVPAAGHLCCNAKRQGPKEAVSGG